MSITKGGAADCTQAYTLIEGIDGNDSNLHFRMDIDTKFNSIDVEADDSIVHYFTLRKADCSSS